MKKCDLETELCVAVVKADPKKVAAALAKGADVNALGDRNALLVAEQTPMWIATKEAALEISEEVRNFRSVMNEALPNPLRANGAQRRRQLIEIIQMLIGARADLEKHCYGSTPLGQAVGGIDFEVVSLLLANGADANAQTFSILSRSAKKVGRKREMGYYDTVLHEAVEKRSVSIVQALLAAGADPKRIDHEGKTPLDIAREKGHIEIVTLLEKARSK